MFEEIGRLARRQVHTPGSGEKLFDQSRLLVKVTGELVVDNGHGQFVNER